VGYYSNIVARHDFEAQACLEGLLIHWLIVAGTKGEGMIR